MLKVEPDSISIRLPQRGKSNAFATIHKNTVRFVAYDAGIRESWVSGNIGDFLNNGRAYPKGKLWRKFGSHLEVYRKGQAMMVPWRTQETITRIV